MKIIREAFFGGERYYCAECGAEVERNFYPTDYVSSSANVVWLHDPVQAFECGIYFSGFHPCNCAGKED